MKTTTFITAQNYDPDSHLTYEVMGAVRTWRWADARMREEIETGRGRIVQTRPGNVPRYKQYLDEQKGNRTAIQRLSNVSSIP